MRKSTIAALSLAICAGSALAQEPAAAAAAALVEGTMFTVPHRSSIEGRVNACGLEFGAIQRDFSTKQGQPVRLSGSFYIRPFPGGGLGYSLKLGLYDGLPPKSVMTAPANAFVKARHDGAAPKGIRSDSDSPGYALFSGAAGNEIVAVIGSILSKREMMVGFNRRPGQQDVVATIDLTVTDMSIVGERVERTRSNAPVDDFAACMGELLPK